MDEPDKKNLPGVVIGNNKAKRQKPSKKKLLLVALGIFLLMVALVAGILLSKKSKDPLYSELTTSEKNIQDIEKLALTDLNGAKQRYQKLIDEQSNKKTKALYYKGKGNLCSIHQDYKCVLESYQEADRLQEEDYFSAYAKAAAHEQLGDKKAAKSGYERAQTLVQSVGQATLDIDPSQIDNDIKRVSE